MLRAQAVPVKADISAYDVFGLKSRPVNMRYNSLRCTKLSTPCRGVNRTFASSAPSYARSRPQGPEGSSEERGGPSRKRDSDNAGQPTGISFDSWMAKIGSQFKEPLPGRTNWLGGTCVRTFQYWRKAADTCWLTDVQRMASRSRSTRPSSLRRRSQMA